MASISYAVLLNKNLNLKKLKVTQIEVVIDVTGISPDPLTLQQIRDAENINSCFQDRRQNINTLVEKVAAQLEKVKNDKEGELLVDALNKKLTSEINTMQNELQVRADKFVQQQKQNVNDLTWAQLKLVVRVVWSAFKYLKGVAEIPAKIVAATGAGMTGAGVFLSVVVLKSLINTVNDLNGFADEVVGALEEERETFKKLKQAVNDLKKIKKPQPVPQSKIDAVENLVGPYGARLLGVDSSAKSTATRLDKLLKDLEQGEFRKKAAKKAAEEAVDAMIKEIIELSKNCAEGRKLLQAAKSKITECSKRAQKDPTSFWDLAGGLWKAFDYMMDMGEKSFDSVSYKTAFKNCYDALTDKLQEELADAQIGETTKL